MDVVSGDVTTYSDLVRETVCLARALHVLLDDIQVEHGGAKADRIEDGQHRDVVGVFVENRREMLPSLVANLLLGSPISLLNSLANTGTRTLRFTRSIDLKVHAEARRASA